MASTSWDPDPSVPYIDVKIIKSSRMVGLKAGDAPSPTEYPFVQMIGVGTPVDSCQEIDIGDKLKSINGVFLKGKKRKEVHDLVKKIDIGSEISFKVIKSFKDKKLVADSQDSSGWGVRVASVRRSNPLMSMMQTHGMEGDALEEVDEEEESLAELPSAPVESSPPPSKFSRKGSVYGGFGDADPEPVEPEPKGKFKRRGSVYNGFGDSDIAEEAESEPSSASATNTVEIDGEDYGFGDMSIGGDWG